MKTIDIHAHLLNKQLSFSRPVDKFLLHFFGKSMGLRVEDFKRDSKDSKEFMWQQDFLNSLDNQIYRVYIETLIRNIKRSKHLDKSVIFSVDSKVDSKGNVIDMDPTVCSDNNDVFELTQAFEHDLIPFFSINPNRKDALYLIDEYYEKGFKGAKFLQNYWDIDTRDPKYKAYFRKLKDYDLPIIIHTGNESVVASTKEYESLNMLYGPLEEGITTIAAHMGIGLTNNPLNNFSKNKSRFPDEYEKIISMLMKFDFLYADMSATLTPLRSRVLHELAKEDIQHKLLFGTDFPVPFTSVFNTYDMKIKDRLDIAKIDNYYDRYIEIISYFFGKDSQLFTNYNKIIT